MIVEITPEIEAIIRSFTAKIEKYNPVYDDERDERVKQSKIIRPHSLGEVDDNFFKKYIPSEPDFAREYKIENFRAITKPYYQKICSTVSKINRAPDFLITFPVEKQARINEEFSLEKYLNKFHEHHSFREWVFNYWVKQLLDEPNGVTVILPSEEQDELDLYVKVEVDCYPAESVIKYEKGEYCILREGENEWYYIDNTYVIEIEKTLEHYNDKGVTKTADRYVIKKVEKHLAGLLPVIYNGGVIKETVDQYGDTEKVFESFIAGIVPCFDQALLENADRNVSIPLHVYPEKETFAQNICTACNGEKTVRESYITKAGKNSFRDVTCKTCEGIGYLTAGAFSTTVRKPQKTNELQIPFPGTVYITKDLEPVKMLNEDVQRLLTEGLKAVNLEFLSEMPANESGVSKVIDWESANDFLYTVANWVVMRMNWMIKVINRERYAFALYQDKGTYKDYLEMDKYLPMVQVPERYDIITAKAITERIESATKAGVSSSYVTELEKRLVEKEFRGDKETVAYQKTVIELDPLRGMTEEDRVLKLTNGGVSQLDYVISSNINNFVWEAYLTNKKFYELEPLQQKAQIKTIAEKYMKEMRGSTPTMLKVAPVPAE